MVLGVHGNYIYVWTSNIVLEKCCSLIILAYKIKIVAIQAHDPFSPLAVLAAAGFAFLAGTMAFSRSSHDLFKVSVPASHSSTCPDLGLGMGGMWLRNVVNQFAFFFGNIICVPGSKVMSESGLQLLADRMHEIRGTHIPALFDKGIRWSIPPVSVCFSYIILIPPCFHPRFFEASHVLASQLRYCAPHHWW